MWNPWSSLELLAGVTSVTAIRTEGNLSLQLVIKTNKQKNKQANKKPHQQNKTET